MSVVAQPQPVVDRLLEPTPPHPRHPLWGQVKLPGWVSSFRQHQWDCAREIVGYYQAGVPVVFLDGPTGSGKTLIAEMVRRLMPAPDISIRRPPPTLGKCRACGRTLRDPESIELGIGPECRQWESTRKKAEQAMVIRGSARAVYVCSGKTLQDQFVGDFDYARVLKGRANYPTLFGGEGVTADDCTSTSPTDPCVTGCYEQTNQCPYRVAKGQAAGSHLAVLNTAYFLAEAGTERSAFGNKRFGLGIFDEADTLESELMSHVEVAITARRMKDLDVGMPQLVTKPESWEAWVKEQVIPAVKKQLLRFPVSTTNLAMLRKKRGWDRLLQKLYVLSEGIASGNWVFDGYRGAGFNGSGERKDDRITFKPVRVDGFGQKLIWRHFNHFLLMSATLISADEMAESLGYDGEYRTVRAPMTFPKENRKIIVAPVADMTNKLKDTEWPKLAVAITNVLRLHEITDKILVHTVSYKLAEYLIQNIRYGNGRIFFTYRNAQERDRALAQFRKSPGAVMFAPSMDRGVDLKGEDCRVCIVAKMPFLNLGDKQISARLHSKGGNVWYQVQTVRSLVQSTGRGVRDADDYCTTYILDRQFLSNTYKKSKHLLPKWWLEAIDMQFNTNQLKEIR